VEQQSTYKGRPVSTPTLDPPPLDKLPEFKEEMIEGYRMLLSFLSTEPFANLLSELKGMSEPEQIAFVNEVILNQRELDRRGVEVPEGIIIQTSEFEALGPDLFVVRTFVRSGLNVNITFFPEMFLPEGERSSNPLTPTNQVLRAEAGS